MGMGILGSFGGIWMVRRFDVDGGLSDCGVMRLRGYELWISDKIPLSEAIQGCHRVVSQYILESLLN